MLGLQACHVTKPLHKGNRRYRYYVCTNAQKTGWSNCPAKSTPALGIENFVVQQIRNVGSDPNLIAETLEVANKHAKEELANLDAELSSLKKDVKAWTKELPTATAGRQADLHERMAAAEKRASDLHEARAKVLVIDPQEVAATR